MEYLERNRVRQWWIWLIFAGSLFYGIYGGLRQFFLGIPTAYIPYQAWVYLLLMVFVLAILVTIMALELVLRLTEEGVEITFGPLARYQWRWKEIRHVKVLYPGFMPIGVRKRERYGKVLSMGGRAALVVDLKKGDRVTATTRQAQKLKGWLEARPGGQRKNSPKSKHKNG